MNPVKEFKNFFFFLLFTIWEEGVCVCICVYMYTCVPLGHPSPMSVYPYVPDLARSTITRACPSPLPFTIGWTSSRRCMLPRNTCKLTHKLKIDTARSNLYFPGTIAYSSLLYTLKWDLSIYMYIYNNKLLCCTTKIV